MLNTSFIILEHFFLHLILRIFLFLIRAQWILFRCGKLYSQAVNNQKR